MATKTWTGAVSTDWNIDGNWSGGDGLKPSSADDVVFSTGDWTITASATISFKTLTTAGATSVSFTQTGAQYIYAYGNVTLKSGDSLVSAGGFRQRASGTFTQAGATLDFHITVYDGSSTLTLGSDITLSSGKSLATRTGCALDTANYAISLSGGGTLGESGAAVCTVTLGSSVISVSKISFPTGTLTLTANTAHITVNTIAGTQTNHFGSSAEWHDVTIVAPLSTNLYDITIDGANTFDNLTLSNGAYRTSRFLLAANQTVSGTCTITGESAPNNIFVKSSVTGTERTITCDDCHFTDVHFQDIKVTGTAPTSTRVGDCGRNTNIGTSTPKHVYAGGIAATKYFYDNIWADDTHDEDDYATRAAAVAVTNYPLPQDTAHFDNASFSGAARTVGTNGCYRIGAIDASTLTDANNFAPVNSTHYGSINVSGVGFGVSLGTATVTFDAVLGDITLTSNAANAWDCTTGGFVIDSYGNDVILGSDFVTDGTFTLTRGAFDMNDQNLSSASFSSSNSNTRSIDFGSGTMTLTGTGTIWDTSTSTGLTITQGTGKIVANNNSASAKTLTFSTAASLADEIYDMDITVASSGTVSVRPPVTAHDINFDTDGTGAMRYGIDPGIFAIDLPDLTVHDFSISGNGGNGSVILRVSDKNPRKLTISGDFTLDGTETTHHHIQVAEFSTIEVGGSVSWTGKAGSALPISTELKIKQGFVTTLPAFAGVSTTTLGANECVAHRFKTPGSNTEDINVNSIGFYGYKATAGAVVKMCILEDDAANSCPSGTQVSNSLSAEKTSPDAMALISHTYDPKPQLKGGTYYWLAIYGGTNSTYLSRVITGASEAVIKTDSITYPTWPSDAQWHGVGAAASIIELFAVLDLTCHWHLIKVSDTATASYMDIQGCQASGGATFDATDNCVDSGDNSGWDFGAAGAFPILSATAIHSSIFGGRVVNG